MEITQLSAHMGASVSGVDVRNMTVDNFEELNRLFCEHQVLVFPDQTLTPDEQLQFASLWGQPVRHPYASMPDHPEIIELKNQGKRRDVNQHWHTDMSYNTCPPLLTMLYAHEVPEFGGDTAFSNQYVAYEEMSDGMKAIVESLKAKNSAASLAGLYKADAGEAPNAVHPVVRTHDVTSKKALYVCRAFTEKIEGWTRRESHWLLEYLFEQATRIEYQWRHHWQKNDLIMWDNRSVLHFAVHDHGDEARTIHRLQVEGPQPV